jgi:EAL domain-containing protein (putative c-di-GMP-specific phosphodiesterase class I)
MGMEVLLRWHNEKLGNISPSDFIYIAEKTGFIHRVGLWVFNEACKQVADWTKQGIEDLFFAINVSPIQLNQEEFTKQVDDIFRTHLVNSSQFEIELTESAIRAEDKLIVQKITSFCEKSNFKLSIDDFGTGYSSLVRLAELPVNTLKIDGVFLKNMKEGSKNYNIVKSTIVLAKSLSLQTIAECVETKEQVDALLQLGGCLAQGFYYYKPMPAEELTAILKRNN